METDKNVLGSTDKPSATEVLVFLAKLHFEFIERKFNILNIFDELILSYIVGSMKPERAIFEEVVKRAGGDRTKILYIDDRDDLIKEATAMGIDSIKFESGEKLEIELKDRGIKV